MAKAAFLGLVALVLLMLAYVSADDNHPLSCPTVENELEPCLDYVTGQQNDPSQDCCSGTGTVVSNMKTKQDRQAVCQWLQTALSGKNYDPLRISHLATKCGISTPIPPVGGNTNCTAIPF